MTYTSDYPALPQEGFSDSSFGGMRAVERSSRWTRRPLFVNMLAVVILLAIWQYLTATNQRVPALDEVFSFLLVELRGESHGAMLNGEFWSPLSVSLSRYLTGLAIGVPLGAALGLLIGGSRRFRAMLDDTVLVLLVLPSVVWAFASSLWFGYGATAPIVAVVVTAVPFMAVNLRSGIAQIDPGLAEMSSSFKVPIRRRVVHLIFGGGLPSAVTGVRLAFMTGWNSLLIVEWFGDSTGVGGRANFWYGAQRFPGFVAWILLFVVFITLLDWLVLRRLERRAVRWRQQPTLTFAEDEVT